MKKRFSEEQIIGFLREADGGLAIKELCRRHGFSEASYYLWRSKFGGMNVSDAKRLRELETENSRLKKLLAESMLENQVTREALRKSGDRTGKTLAGAADAIEGTERTPCVARAVHECQRLAPCDTNRQWQRVLRSRHADLGTRAGRHAATYRAGQAQSERLHRKLQRPPTR